MLTGRASKPEGRRGSQSRLCEGGRYLGIPPNGGLPALRERSEGAVDHNHVLLSVQETGCGTVTLLNEPSEPTDFAASSNQGMVSATGASARSFTVPKILLPSVDSQCGPA